MSKLLTDVLTDYLRANIRIRKESTRKHYLRSFQRFGEYLGHPPTLDDLTDDNCTGFILWTLDHKKMTENTANQRVKQIRALWNWCAKRRLVEQFPSFHDVTEPENIPKAWSPEQLAMLFAGCEKQTGFVGRCYANAWWLAIHHFWLDSGERTEATLLLKWEWYDAKKSVISVPSSVRKGGRKAMVYRLSKRTIDCLEAIREPSRDLIFEHHWATPCSFYHGYKRLLASAGLPIVRGKCGPKRMRITVFTMIEMAGGDASKFARHSTRKVTDDSYIDRTMTSAVSKNVWPPAKLPFAEKGSGMFSRMFNKLGLAGN